VTIAAYDKRITVTFPRRAHNPILLDAGIFGPMTEIPWRHGWTL
jgi:hypothetical protein